ncbi:MAG: hypothetical protein JST40_11735 [Armatimonadetes bacterium]|nr:hypothetical protein [Armatimonadota bacterium]
MDVEVQDCIKLIDREIAAKRWHVTKLPPDNPEALGRVVAMHEFYRTYGSLQTEFDCFEPNIGDDIDLIPLDPGWHFIGISDIFAGYAIKDSGEACAYEIEYPQKMSIEYLAPTIWHLLGWLAKQTSTPNYLCPEVAKIAGLKRARRIRTCGMRRIEFQTTTILGRCANLLKRSKPVVARFGLCRTEVGHRILLSLQDSGEAFLDFLDADVDATLDDCSVTVFDWFPPIETGHALNAELAALLEETDAYSQCGGYFSWIANMHLTSCGDGARVHRFEDTCYNTPSPRYLEVASSDQGSCLVLDMENHGQLSMLQRVQQLDSTVPFQGSFEQAIKALGNT